MSNGYKWFVAVLSVLWAITVALDIYYMLALYGPYFHSLSTVLFPVFVIIPFPQLLFFLPGVFTAFWFGVLIFVFSVFFIYALVTGFEKLDRSAIFRISEFYALNLFLSLAYFLIIDALGKPVANPLGNSVPFFYNMFELTNAGLYEELITRVLYIGIPLYIYYRLKMGPNGEREKHVPFYRAIWGGNYKFGKPEITVLVISSIIFGVAHASSWDWSKVPQAALGGFFLGILFLRYGLFADVLFHFSIDSTDAFLPTTLGNPLANGATTGFATFIDLLFVFAGIVVLISYFFRLRNYMNVRKNGAVPSAVQDYNQCPRCQSTDSEIIYQGVYRCKNCGNIFKKV